MPETRALWTRIIRQHEAFQNLAFTHRLFALLVNDSSINLERVALSLERVELIFNHPRAVRPRELTLFRLDHHVSAQRSHILLVVGGCSAFLTAPSLCGILGMTRRTVSREVVTEYLYDFTLIERTLIDIVQLLVLAVGVAYLIWRQTHSFAP